jgi:hypothetical protein
MKRPFIALISWLLVHNTRGFVSRIASTIRTRHHCSSTRPLLAQPKQGSIVDSYQTVSVHCVKCKGRLFRYKKKNGTKTSLTKCYIERIVDDCAGVVKESDDRTHLTCPTCETNFARPTMIHGLPALKLVGGKVRMTK